MRVRAAPAQSLSERCADAECGNYMHNQWQHNTLPLCPLLHAPACCYRDVVQRTNSNNVSGKCYVDMSTDAVTQPCSEHLQSPAMGVAESEGTHIWAALIQQPACWCSWPEALQLCCSQS